MTSKQGQPWTPDEEQKLSELLETHNIRDIAEIMGRTKTACEKRVVKLGLRIKVQLRRNWTEEERDQLRYLLSDYTVPQIAKLLGRSNDVVRQEMRKRGYKSQVRRTPAGLKVKARNWSEEEIRYLRSNHHRLAVSQIAKDLDRTIHSVDSKVRNLGLNRSKPMGVSELAELLGTSAETVRQRRDKLGLEFCKVVDGSPARIRGLMPFEIHAICTDILDNPGSLWVSSKKVRKIIRTQEILMGRFDESAA